jgi:hypothetical protein
MTGSGPGAALREGTTRPWGNARECGAGAWGRSHRQAPMKLAGMRKRCRKGGHVSWARWRGSKTSRLAGRGTGGRSSGTPWVMGGELTDLGA